jgi:hypothetical protein
MNPVKSTSPFISDERLFASSKANVEKCFRLKEQLPSQVFQEGFIRFEFEEFDWAMSSEFWLSIQDLSRFSGDESCLVAVLDPHPSDYYKKEFGFFNWANLPVSASPDEYWSLLNQHPDGSPADSLLANSEKIVWLPQSGKWAVWGVRSSEVCILGWREAAAPVVWHDVDWALKTAVPNCFRDRVVPQDFAERLRKNYAA